MEIFLINHSAKRLRGSVRKSVNDLKLYHIRHDLLLF